MKSKTFFYTFICICFFQLCFRFVYAEMYPSLLYPSFSIVPKVNMGEFNQETFPKIFNTINEDVVLKENPKLIVKKGNLTTKDLIKATNLNMFYRTVLCDSTIINTNIDYANLFAIHSNYRAKFLERKKFTNYPVRQDNFFEKDNPYTESDIAELELYFKKRASHFLGIEINQETICELYLIFDRVSKKEKISVHKLQIRLK